MAHVLHMFPGPGRKSASIACLLEAFVTLQGLLTETHQLKATEKRDPLVTIPRQYANAGLKLPS